MEERQESFTTKEAAAELGVTPSRIRQMIIDGSLPATKRGRDQFIARADLEAARARQTRPGPRVTTGTGLRRRRKTSETPRSPS